MKDSIVILSYMNIAFLLMHELDACYRGEWKMFKPLRVFEEHTQYLIFLYLHLPIFVLSFYYLLSVLSFTNKTLWIVVNIFGIAHLGIHLIARKWVSNVFTSFHSFIFIVGEALTGIMSLFLFKYYL